MRAESGVDRQSARVPALEQRIDFLESLVLRAVAAVTVILLGVGSVLTVAFDPDSEIRQWSLLTAPVQVYGTLMNSDNVPYSLAVMVGAGLLLVAVLVAMGVCSSIVRREGSKRTLILAKIVAALVLAAAGVVLIFSLVAGSADAERAEAGAAMWWFIPGAAFFGLLVGTESLRRLWYVGA